MEILDPLEGGQGSRLVVDFDESTVLVRASSQRLALLTPDTYEHEVSNGLACMSPATVVEIRTNKESRYIVKTNLRKYAAGIDTYVEVTLSHGQNPDPAIVEAGRTAWALHAQLSQEEQVDAFRTEIEALTGEQGGSQDS